MKTDTRNRIIEYIKKKREAKPGEIVDFLGISYQAVSRQLVKLIESGEIKKIGRSPRVFYSLSKPIQENLEFNIDEKKKKIIDEKFFFVSPLGEIKNGFDGFIYWCKERDLDVVKTAKEYIQTIDKYESFKKEGLINGMEKMKSTFEKVFLDKLYYLDFYSIERFGKTKLGQMLLHAKQSQNKELIRSVVKEIKPKILEIIDKYDIDGVGFIPPTVKRQVQFMKELDKNLNLKINKVSIVKVKTAIAVAQKTLNKLEDRIKNARNTIIVEENKEYNNILIIDDAVGSGSTLNEVAKKIKDKGICKGKIIGLSITGSFKGFDVISEI